MSAMICFPQKLPERLLVMLLNLHLRLRVLLQEINQQFSDAANRFCLPWISFLLNYLNFVSFLKETPLHPRITDKSLTVVKVTQTSRKLYMQIYILCK